MEHRFDDLLKTIVSTIKNDYAGFAEKKDIHDSRYYVQTTGTAFKKGVLDELLFLRIVSQYLASLGDPSLRFSMIDHEGYENYGIGFCVRRHGDDLYVTEALQESRVQVGDRIRSINQQPAGKHRAHFMKNIVIGNTAEREQWHGFLKMADHFEVEHADGSTEDLSFGHYPLEAREPRLSFETIKDGVCKLVIECFSADTTALEALLVEHEAELNACKTLILDLRKNEGGSESGFAPLLGYLAPFLCEQGHSLLCTNYTRENCSHIIRELTVRRAQRKEAGDLASVAVANELISEFRSRAGQGFVIEPEEPFEKDATKGQIEKLVLLTDTWCRDAGEVFVQLFAGNEGVAVVGRPTMGTIDYTNSVAMILDGTYVLSYPMSKRHQVEEGKRYNETGLPVDVYLPWTPEELKRDLLLEKALEL